MATLDRLRSKSIICSVWRILLIVDSQRRPSRQRPGSNQFQRKLDVVPQRQYHHPTEIPLAWSPPMEVAIRPPMPVVFAKPTYISNQSLLPRTYHLPEDGKWRNIPEVIVEPSTTSIHIRVSGVTKEGNGRVAVVVTDSRGNRARGVSLKPTWSMKRC